MLYSVCTPSRTSLLLQKITQTDLQKIALYSAGSVAGTALITSMPLTLSVGSIVGATVGLGIGYVSLVKLMQATIQMTARKLKPEPDEWDRQIKLIDEIIKSKKQPDYNSVIYGNICHGRSLGEERLIKWK